MENKYKIVISNRNLYKETELPAEAKVYRVGTSIECEFRLHKELFFDEVRLDFINNAGNWSVICSDNIYISRGDVRRLLTMKLEHGDSFAVKYQESDNEAFFVEFMLDFDSRKRKFERKIDISGVAKVSLGSGSENDICLKGEYISSDKIELIKSEKGLQLEIKNAAYGVYHDGNRASSREIIKSGDFVSISDFMFYYRDGMLWTEISDNCIISRLPYTDEPKKAGYPMFVRNTRLKYKLPEGKIDLLIPPEKPKKPKQNLALTLLPALAMLVITVVIRGFMSQSSNNSYIIFSVCTMGMGIITSVITYLNTKKQYRTDCEERIKQYNNYIEKKREEITGYRKKEQGMRKAVYRDTAEDIDIISGFKPMLFDRLKEDGDFLNVYLGKGPVTASCSIDYKKQEAFETDDELAEIPYKISREYEKIEDCPIVLDLYKANAAGIVGSREQNYELLKNMITDIICRHYYGEVQLFLLIDKAEPYLWAKKIPHLVSGSGIRNIVYDQESRNNIFESLYKELTIRSTMKDCGNLVYLVILVQNEWGIKTHPVSQFISEANRLNVSFVFFENDRSEVPLYCDTLVMLSGQGHGEMICTANGAERAAFEYQTVTDADMYKICGILEPVYSEEISLESTLRKNITLFELMNIYTVDDIDLGANWDASQVWNTMGAPIGVNAKNEIVTLNLHEKFHGPHGLVAGTTGSGKSEILQTYILSVASLFHPYEISFVIIDFKGGGMVNQFKELPHLIGAITNIDGHEIDRSLRSIKAELLKRQELFAKTNVNHIDKYIKLYKEKQVKVPLPHLVIIVDEFAELKAEQPDFMKELISAARIGRSLGVHLILATQKPSGQVNEQIWSNSRFKLCLKVQTREDSNEVLKSPLAAEIKEPGRAYLQVGNNELFELLQSGYSGALEKAGDADGKSYTISKVDFGGKRNILFRKKKESGKETARTQLEAIVQYIGDYCRKEDIKKLPNICLPPLEDKISIMQSQSGYTGESIPVGIYDAPDLQYQGEAKLNITGENLLIIGSAGSGKTNLLQVIIRQLAGIYSPGQVNIYIMDFGTMYLKNFEKMNHVGGVVTISEEEKLKNLFKLLTEEIQIRKDRFMKAGISSFYSYLEAGYEDLPQIFVMLDNFAAFKEVYSDAYEEEFIYITREGLSCGMNVIVANAQTSGLGFKYMSNFAGKIALHCNDLSEYSSVFDRCRMQPKETAGRGICRLNKELYEVQVYLAFEGEKEIQRSEAVNRFIQEMNERYAEQKAKKIPEIPKELSLEYIEDNYRYQRERYSYPAGLDYASVDVVNLNFGRVNELCIVGNDADARINALESILQSMEYYLLEESVKVYIIDNLQRKLKHFGEKVYVEHYSVDYGGIGEIISGLREELEERYKLLMEEESAENGKQPLLVAVVNNREAVDFISTNKDVLAEYNRVIKQYKSLGICFIYSDIEDASIPYGAPEIMKRFKDNKNTVITTPNLRDVKFCDVPTSARKMKPLDRGDIFLFAGSDVNRLKIMEVRKHG